MVKNILIIEDDQFFSELISKKLKDVGFKVFGAIDGEAGIEKVNDLNPDLILLDLLLPKRDGFEVLSVIKGNPETAAIPVVILSNLSSQQDIEKGLKLGASDYLIKSQFDFDEVISKIKKFI